MGVKKIIFPLPFYAVLVVMIIKLMLKQSSRRRWTNVLHVYIWGLRKNTGSQDHSALRLTGPFWTRQREAAVWNFKGKGSNSQVNEKKWTFGKPYCAGHPGMMGHKGDSVAGIVPVAILNSYM